jgi:uncharacterized protein YuzE
MTHADVLDCLSANPRINFLAHLPEDAYKGTRITVGEAIEYFLDEEGEVRGVECLECGGYSWCHHMNEEMQAREAYDIYYDLAEAEATGN